MNQQAVFGCGTEQQLLTSLIGAEDCEEEVDLVLPVKGDCDCLDVTMLFSVHDVVLFAPVPVGNPGSQGEVSHCVCKGPSYVL